MTTAPVLPREIDLALRLLERIPSNAKNGEVGNALITALALHGILARNREQTLVEHFDGIRASYSAIFKVLQATGMEDAWQEEQSRRATGAKQ